MTPSPELRKDPVLGRWVLIAGGSFERPRESRADAREGTDAGAVACRVCARVPELEGAPLGALSPEAKILDRRQVVERSRRAGSLQTCMSGAGEHELLVLDAGHGRSLAEMPVEHVSAILRLFRERIVFFRQDNRFRHTVVLLGWGPLAGVEDVHLVAEAFALPLVPPSVKEKIQGLVGYHRKLGSCAYCDVVKHERSDRSRSVGESLRHVALAPYASRSPFELLFLPKGHHADFTSSSDADLGDLARLLTEVLGRLERLIPDISYRIVLETAPPEMGADLQHFHWHLELQPVLSPRAPLYGVLDVNPISPEEAARWLVRPPDDAADGG